MFLSLLKKFLVVFVLATLPFKAYSLSKAMDDPTVMAIIVEQMEEKYEQDKESRQNIHNLASTYSAVASKKYKAGQIEEGKEYYKKAIDLFKISYDKSPESASYEAINISEAYVALARVEKDKKVALNYLEEAIKYGKKALEIGNYSIAKQTTSSKSNEEVSFFLNVKLSEYCTFAIGLLQIDKQSNADAKILEYMRYRAKHIENAINIAEENKLINKLRVNIINFNYNAGVAYIFLGESETDKELKIESYKKGIERLEKVTKLSKKDYRAFSATASAYDDLSHLYEKGSKEQKLYYKNAIKNSKSALKFASTKNLIYVQYNIIEMYLKNQDFKSALSLLKEYTKSPQAFILFDKDKQKWLDFIAQDEDEKRREQILSLVKGLKHSNEDGF